MRLGEALYREITGGRSPRTEIGTWGDAVGWFLGRNDTIAGAAREAGVAPSTFRGWLSGRMPRAGRAGAIVGAALMAQRRSRLGPRREARVRAMVDEYTVEIAGEYEYDARGRTIAIATYLDPIGDDLVDAYLAGEDIEDLAVIFHGGIHDAPFYEQMLDPTAEPGHGFDYDYIAVGGGL